MLPLDGYIRVSRVGGREGEGFISPDVQERAIREWAGRNGVDVVVQPHELNVSGGTMDRPVFNRIMERIRAGESGGVVVYKTDRFARTLVGAVNTLAEIGAHGAAFASATEPSLDYTTPGGKAFLQTMFVFAEFVRSSLKESWAVAQRSAVDRGVHIAPNGFLGYVKGPDGRLVPNADAPLVVEAFKRRAGGEGWGSLAAWLDGAAPLPDGGLWTGKRVLGLCAKRVYRGEASRYVVQDVDGRGPVVNAHAHPALVTEGDWQAAQVNPRLARGGRRDGKPLPLLSELARCAACRYSLSQGPGQDGERMYKCRGKHASGRCPEPAHVLAEVLEHHVEEAVLAEIDGALRLVPDSGDRDAAVADVARARADLNEFKRDTGARRKLGAEWHEWLDEYLQGVRAAEAELQRLDARTSAGIDGLTREHYLALPLSERREVLAGFVDVVFVRRSRGRGRNVDPIGRRSRILWRGQGPSDLPRRRVRNSIVPFAFDEDYVEPWMVPAKDGAEGL